MAKEVTYWEATDGSLHKTEIEAVEADIVLLGGDDAYFEMLVEELEQCKEKLKFNYIGFPVRIAYRLMYSGYIGQLYTSFSNADLAEQYSIFFYKKGVKPTMQLKMVIQHEKDEKYKHFKELYGVKEPTTLREAITKDTKSNCDYENEKFEFSDSYLNTELAKMTTLTNKFGEYSILYYRDNYFLFSGIEMKYHILLNESHGHDLNLEKGVLIIYGHEQIVCVFTDGTLTEIHTR